LNEEERKKIVKQIHPLTGQHIFFTTIDYGTPYHIVHNVKRNITENDEVLLVCGIANPRPLKQFLFDHAGTYYQIDYRDHHIFTIDDLSDIIERFRNISADSKFIITTEKDAVRLSKFKQQLTELPLYVLPIRHRFLFEEESSFNNLIFNYIANFKVNSSNEQEKRKENNQAYKTGS